MAKTDPDTWMWQRAKSLLDEADRRSRDFCRPVAARHHRTTWEPPIDVFETPGDIWILVALPGVDPAAVEIVVEGTALVIRGVRAVAPHLRHAELVRMELPKGRFERRLPLASGRYELVERELDRGCLSIRLAKIL